MLKFFVVLLISNGAFANMDTIDAECRIQAKETAVTAYQSCVKESRTQKIEEIRKEYQGKLHELKSYYDNEMKKMSSTQKGIDKAVEAQTTPEVTLKKKGKSAGRASAKSGGLPAKKIEGKSLPVRSEPEVRMDSPASITTEESIPDSDVVNVDEGAI